MGSTTVIQSVRRAMQLMNLFTPHRPIWSVSALSQATGLHKSVVSRLMSSMATDGFVIQDPQLKTYRVGPQAFAVGSTYRPFAVLEELARPVLEELVAETGHSSSLGVAAGSRFIIILSLQGNQAVRVAFEVGEQPFYHGAAIGKALLAYLDDSEVRRIVGPDPLQAITPHSITSIDRLLEDLCTIRKTGLALSQQESIIGVSGLAVGVANANGVCVAGIGIAFPTHLVNAQEMSELGKLTARAGARLSKSVKTLSLDALNGRDRVMY